MWWEIVWLLRQAQEDLSLVEVKQALALQIVHSRIWETSELWYNCSVQSYKRLWMAVGRRKIWAENPSKPRFWSNDTFLSKRSAFRIASNNMENPLHETQKQCKTAWIWLLCSENLAKPHTLLLADKHVPWKFIAGILGTGIFYV